VTGEQTASDGVEARERDFWDHHLYPVTACLRTIERGGSPNMAAMVDALGDVEGKRVIDFACGSGITTGLLAQRGAMVTAVDLSPLSLRRTREVADALGLGDQVVTTTSLDGLEPGFAGAVGHYALHHVDIAAVGAQIADLLEDGATAAFVETFATNPLLSLSRKLLVGRFGIPRLGTLDEHPLTRSDVRDLAEIFGTVEIEVAEMQFMRIFDRQVARRRIGAVTKASRRIDDVLVRSRRLWFLSYHQVVVCRLDRTRATG
jgi:SAM-dependent methyltransferase